MRIGQCVVDKVITSSFFFVHRESESIADIFAAYCDQVDGTPTEQCSDSHVGQAMREVNYRGCKGCFSKMTFNQNFTCFAVTEERNELLVRFSERIKVSAAPWRPSKSEARQD